MMFAAAAAGVIITMVMVLFRSLVGPNIYNRILAVNAFGTLSVMLIAIYGFVDGRPEFLDLAIVYALINFIGTIAVTKYVTFSDMGHGDDGDPMGDI
ncbi:MAG: monovalent cation/H+ antiporter complex subunit F [Rhodospirillales bacterium]|jgi:multicomponent Na+:H+ antiporter subunit F|nr:monovalent cation/H+ antiporter complex subunit F [Rhodospirillales bacterium]